MRRPQVHPREGPPQYNHCCLGGQVSLPRQRECPKYMKQLLSNKDFMENIRAYNQIFTMISLGADVDASINNGMGPQRGQKKRLHHFGGEESGLKREIVEGWIDFLNNNNALVQLFRTARNKMSEVDIPEYQQLQERVRQYKMITRGRLFQQYVVVTAYCAIEQSRTDFLRAKQNEIRNEFLSTLYYAITRGDQDGRDAGSRIILPVSFTGGPRADVIDRVLQHLTAERSKVCKDEDVDAHVSAELPDPIVDPEGLRDQEVQILAVHLENMQHVSSRRHPVRHLAYSLGHDQEWGAALKEVAFTATAGELCAQILIFCDVSDPVSLWKSHWKTMSDDIPRRLYELLRIPEIHLRGPELEAGVLYELEVALTGYGKSVQNYGVPLPPPRLLDILKNKTFMEKKNYDRE
nr:helitron helicase-like domain-containing protein [Tanacetum cinerariifolium]